MLFYGITYVYLANIANLFHVGNILFVRKHINFVLYDCGNPVAQVSLNKWPSIVG